MYIHRYVQPSPRRILEQKNWTLFNYHLATPSLPSSPRQPLTYFPHLFNLWSPHEWALDINLRCFLASSSLDPDVCSPLQLERVDEGPARPAHESGTAERSGASGLLHSALRCTEHLAPPFREPPQPEIFPWRSNYRIHPFASSEIQKHLLVWLFTIPSRFSLIYIHLLPSSPSGSFLLYPPRSSDNTYIIFVLAFAVSQLEYWLSSQP